MLWRVLGIEAKNQKNYWQQEPSKQDLTSMEMTMLMSITLITPMTQGHRERFFLLVFQSVLETRLCPQEQFDWLVAERHGGAEFLGEQIPFAFGRLMRQLFELFQ